MYRYPTTSPIPSPLSTGMNHTTQNPHNEWANKEITKTAIFVDKLMALQNPLTNLVFDGITLLIVWLSLNHLETDITYLGDMMAFVQYASQVMIAFLILTMLFVVLPRANVSAGVSFIDPGETRCAAAIISQTLSKQR